MKKLRKLLSIIGVLGFTLIISTTIVAYSCLNYKSSNSKEGSTWTDSNGAINSLLNVNNTIYVGTWTDMYKGKFIKANL